jgi:AcrR family transcriptional regulator
VPKVSQEYRDGRRNEILDAAWACFAEKGYHGTTMQDICDESEMSPGAVYRYFKGKEEILGAINQRSQEMARKLVGDARAGSETPLNALWMIGDTFLAAFEDPDFETMTRVNLEIWPEVMRSDSLRGSAKDELAFWHTAVTAILRQAQSEGTLHPDIEPEAAAALFICAYEGLRRCWFIDRERFRPEQLLDLGRVLAPGGSRDNPPLRTATHPESLPLGTSLRKMRGKDAQPKGASRQKGGQKR